MYMQKNVCSCYQVTEAAKKANRKISSHTDVMM